jgi:superfamily I DNA and/or RNA helicase
MLGYKAKEIVGDEFKKIDEECIKIRKDLQQVLSEIGNIRKRIYSNLDSSSLRRLENELIKEFKNIGKPEWEIKKRFDENKRRMNEQFTKEARDLLEKKRKLEKRLDELEKNKAKILQNNMKMLINEAMIIGSTLIKSQLPPLNEVNDFDYVIIDESSQATITLALLGMIKGKRWILVGDDNQLPPIFKSIKNIAISKKKSKKFSAFSHLVEKYPNRVTWLRIHYRSNEKIINFSANEVYNGNIKPHESCKNKKLPIEYWYRGDEYKILDPDLPVVFVHVNGTEEKVNGSRVNREEINTVLEIARMLKECRIDMNGIGIITPFREQARFIRDRIKNITKNIEVSTVDSFQGREKDVVIFSVTSTSRMNFVSDINRFNVAITRPKYKLIVVGNAKKIKEIKNEKLIIKKFLNYVDGLKSIFDFNDKKIISLN